MKHLNLKLGDIFYGVQSQKKYEVTKLDDTGVYLCCFKGRCSDIRHVWSGTTEAEFLNKFDATYTGALEKEIIQMESHAKDLREFLDESKDSAILPQK